MARVSWDGPRAGQHTMTVDVYVTRRYRLRLWVAKQLFGLAGRVMRMGVRVEEHDVDALRALADAAEETADIVQGHLNIAERRIAELEAKLAQGNVTGGDDGER